MKQRVATVIMAALMASLTVMPAFAHCHGSRYEYSSREAVCEFNCEDGLPCGVDGHYCSDHRESESCDGYTQCEPVRRSSHHHRHH